MPYTIHTICRRQTEQNGSKGLIFPLSPIKEILVWIHRCPTDSWKLLRLHWESFTLPFQWAKIVIHPGRRQSTRWSVNWTLMYQLNSKVITLYKNQETTWSCATVTGHNVDLLISSWGKKKYFFKIIIIKLKTKIGHLKSNVDSAILMAVGCIYIYCQSFLFHHWLDRCMYFAILYSNNTYFTWLKIFYCWHDESQITICFL